MVLYGAGASSVVWWGAGAVSIILAIWGFVTLTLGLVGVVQVVRIHKLSNPPVARQRFNRALARNIGVVIAIYSIAEAVSATVLHALQRDPLIFPIAVAIAGVHFGVFARVLDTWQYFITGLVDCLGVAVTLLIVSPGSMVGTLSAWIFYPLVAAGIALFLTAGLMLYESGAILVRLSHAASEVSL